ncbi:hypothetical protein [Yersinia proxima]|uniref:hypothetical protein n=1 Tax=Yersinia proxima TaxID=2890316 RepID=UPI0037D57F70
MSKKNSKMPSAIVNEIKFLFNELAALALQFNVSKVVQKPTYRFWMNIRGMRGFTPFT